MSAPPSKAGKFPWAPPWACFTSTTVCKRATGNTFHCCSCVPGNSSSVWELALLSDIRLHCKPMALVVLPACTYWLQDMPPLSAASIEVMTQIFDTSDVVRGMPVVGIAASSSAVNKIPRTIRQFQASFPLPSPLRSQHHHANKLKSAIQGRVRGVTLLHRMCDRRLQDGVDISLN